jgi:hypothetical protein
MSTFSVQWVGSWDSVPILQNGRIIHSRGNGLITYGTEMYMSRNHAHLYIIAFVDDDFRYIIHWELTRDKPVRTTTEAFRCVMQAFQPAVHELRMNNIDPWYIKAYPLSQHRQMERFWRTLDHAMTVQSMRRFLRGSSTSKTIIDVTRRLEWLLPKRLPGCLCGQRLASLMKSPMS